MVVVAVAASRSGGGGFLCVYATATATLPVRRAALRVGLVVARAPDSVNRRQRKRVERTENRARTTFSTTWWCVGVFKSVLPDREIEKESWRLAVFLCVCLRVCVVLIV